MALSLTEMEKGSWVIFDLPGFTTAASGTQQNSLDALRKASETSYFKDKGELWVKVVSPGDPGNGAPGGGASVSVSRDAEPCCMSKSPRHRPGAFQGVGSRTSSSRNQPSRYHGSLMASWHSASSTHQPRSSLRRRRRPQPSKTAIIARSRFPTRDSASGRARDPELLSQIGARAPEFVAGFTAIIAEIRARQPQAKILLSAAFPRGQLDRAHWREVAENTAVYRKLADEQTVFYVNIGERFFLPDGSHNQEMWRFPPLSRGVNAGTQTSTFEVWAEELQPWLDRFVR